jgi:hypothetical protein
MHRLPHGAARTSPQSVQTKEAGGRNPDQNIEEENRANENFDGAYQGHGIRSTHGGLNSQSRRQDRRKNSLPKYRVWAGSGKSSLWLGMTPKGAGVQQIALQRDFRLVP